MAYRKVGEAVTDQNGRAVINYSGTGAGLIELIAETTIDGRTIQSEIYSIIDGLVYDDCTQAITGRWYNYQSILSVSYSTNGMTITKNEENNTSRYLYWNDSAISTVKIGGYNTITIPMCIEFDVTAITGSIQLVFQDNASTPNQRFIDITNTGHYRIVLDGSTVTVYCDNAPIGNSLALTGTNTQFRFGFNAQNESLTFKNFVVYPI